MVMKMWIKFPHLFLLFLDILKKYIIFVIDKLNTYENL